MDWLVSIAQFIVNEILAVPAFLIGIITAVGLVALKRSTGQVVGGAIKATLGFLLIGAGATLVVASLAPLGAMIQGATGAQGVIPTNEAIAGIAQSEFGAQVSWLMILGFAVSLLLARFTPLHYVFLTGHHILFMATLLTIVLASADYPGFVVVGLGGLVLGILMVSLPAFAHPWTRRVTGDDSIAIGHFGTLAYVAGGAVGGAVGRRSRSTEELDLPESLRFLRDSMVATALSMVIMYLVLAVAFLARSGEEEAFAAFDGGATGVGNYLMLSVTQGLQFGVAVAVILFGVRTILAELVPAFQGIAAKVVPGAIPALDAPIVFPYAQNAVLIGFIASFVGGLVGLVVLSVALNPWLGLALILPGLVPHFFTGGAAGVFGNATGGRVGAAVAGLVNGLLITFLPALLLEVLGDFGDANTTFGDTDFGWVGLATGYPARLGSVGIALIALVGAVILVGAILWQKRVVDVGWDPAPWRDDLEPADRPDLGDGAGTAEHAPGDLVVAGSGYAPIPPPKGAPMPPPPPEQ
ncbi:PTS ascorbate transporter subunit IIC [Nocardioides sp. HDW12B]|uniref:PTS ascorbate transporter subunit IIC n=1 Tax=Nocardioides sp. HDW12B TaxID=2714939 RepID=UPI0014074F7D|nr:PTS ascorbate transporter subunit IIC [Nocardioides sp. HDW12B]